MSSITLFPKPPPTFNNLEPLQRTRLLRSTRKLEALLGTTPYVVEQADMAAPTVTPKARRREGQIFEDPLYSPITFATPHSPDSKPSANSDGSFVLISPTSTLETPLPPFELTFNTNDSDVEISLFSEKQKTATRVNHKKMIPEEPSRPIRKSKKFKSSCKKLASSTAPTPLPHTLVLCLRSVPVSHIDPRHARGHEPSYLPSTYPPSLSSRPTTQTQGQTQVHTLQILNVPASPSSPTLPSPISPLSPTFNSSNHSESERERVEQRQKSKERDQRRKKMAKLTRTLGENVPPELVFPAPAPVLVTTSDTTQKPSRSRSLTMRKSTTSQMASSVDPRPVSALERRPSRHCHEKKQGGAAPERASGSTMHAHTHAGHSEGHWPPSLTVLFHPHPHLHPHPHSTSERPHHHQMTQSSPLPSPIDSGVFIKHEVCSDSYPPSTSTSPSASAPAPTPTPPIPTPAPLRTSLSLRKPASAAAGGKVTRSHSVKSQRSVGVVDEVFGTAQHQLQHQQECGRRKELGWSGEWNRGNMVEVVKALRGLKTR